MPDYNCLVRNSLDHCFIHTLQGYYNEWDENKLSNLLFCINKTSEPASSQSFSFGFDWS